MFFWKSLSKRLLFVVAILLLASLSSACGNEPEATAVPEVAQATATDVLETSTPIPTETETAVPPTDTPTITPSPQPTDTPPPTATEEPTETSIPTDTPTALPSPVPSDTPAPTVTAVPSTEVPPTAAPVSAHTFPETPIQPFDADTFIRYLGLVRDSFRSFNSELSIFEQNGKPGDCGTFIGWTGLWILEAPGFTDVPADWQPLYVEYRSMLRQIVGVTAEIRPLCSGEGGEVSAETTQALFDFFAWAYPRIEVMVTEASQIPR